MTALARFILVCLICLAAIAAVWKYLGFTVLLWAFALFAVGGVIALLGDRLGTYVGKKRLSVFNLRPKHTAMIYTAGFGGLIAVFTLGFLVLQNDSYQRALVFAKRLRQQILFSQNQYAALQSENISLKQQTERAKALTVQAQGEEKRVESQARQVEARAARVEAQEKLAEVNLTAARVALRVAQTEYIASQDNLRLKQRALSVTNVSLKLTKSDLVLAEAAYQKAQDDVRQKAQQVAQKQADLVEKQKEVTDAEAMGRQLTLDNKTLADKNQDLLAQNDDLIQKNKELTDQNSLLTGEALIYAKGVELDRTPISANQDKGHIKNAVLNFLTSISDDAVKKGAKPGKNGMGVVLTGIQQSAKSPVVPVESEDLAIDGLVELISAAKTRKIAAGVSLVATAGVNAVAGEQVSVILHPWKNDVVFKKGQDIASETIDGAQERLQIRDILTDFLQHKVVAAAVKAGVIPVVDPTATRHLSLKSYTDQDETLATIDRILKMNTEGWSAKVTVYAADDIYNNGPVPIHFRVD